jgi:hypothetical protein
MIKKLSRQQILLLGAPAGLLLVALVFGWFGLSGLGSVLEQAQALSDKKGSGDLSALLGRPGGISAARKDTAEIAKLSQDLGTLEETCTGPWAKSWEQASGVGMDWSKDPGKWKDKLVADNDEILKKCGRSGDASSVTLGENFYLGLEEFKQKSPSMDQVPALARELSVAKKLVDLLLLAKKTPEGYATPCVFVALEGPHAGSASGTDVEKVKKTSDLKSTEIQRERYRLKLVCSPEVLYEYVRLLKQDAFLFIITNLSLANEKESFLKRGEIAKLFQPEPPAQGGPSEAESPRGGGKETEKAKLLLVLSGKEWLEVNLEIDYVGWKRASAQEKKQEAKK